LMKRMRDVMFTRSGDRFAPLTEHEFVTHCELNDDRCVFIVHVPEYRSFEDDAKEKLATVAWTVAQGTVEEKLQPGDRLAVDCEGPALWRGLGR